MTIRAGPEPAPETLKLERAQLFLEGIRVGLQQRSDSDLQLDLEATAINYHPFLRAAKLLASDKVLAPSVRKAIDELPLPDDIRPLFESAAGVVGVKPTKAPTAQRTQATLAQVNRAIEALSYEERAVLLIDDAEVAWEVAIGANSVTTYARVGENEVAGPSSQTMPSSLQGLPDAQRELSNLKVLVQQKATVLANRITAPTFELIPAEYRRLEFQSRANAIELQGDRHAREWDPQAKAWGFPERIPLEALREPASVGAAEDYERFLLATAVMPRPDWATPRPDLDSQHAARVEKLPSPERDFVMQSHHLSRPMRLALLESAPMTTEQIGALYSPVKDLPYALSALVEWAALRGGDQQAALRQFFERSVSEGSMQQEEVRLALASVGSREYSSEVFVALDAAVKAVTESDLYTRDAALDGLMRLIATNTSPFVTRQTLADQALHGLLAHDLRQVLPLGDADAALGSVAAKAFVDGRPVEERLGLNPVGAAPAQIFFDSFARSTGGGAMKWQEAQHAFPQLAHRLGTLKSQLEMQAVGHADFVGAATDQTMALLNQHLLPTLTSTTGDENGKTYRAGRAFIEGMISWAEALQLEL